MPSLEDVFAKFGATAETCQLLELKIGNLLLSDAVKLHGFDRVQSKSLAKKIVEEIDRKTLGQLIHALRRGRTVPSDFERELGAALTARNRLNHSFYMEHNLRRNSEEGRKIMLADLEVIFQTVQQAYRSASQLSNIPISPAALTAAEKLSFTHT